MVPLNAKRLMGNGPTSPRNTNKQLHSDNVTCSNQRNKARLLETKTFSGGDGNQYIVFRTLDGSYHTFVEVEAKQAARQCGAEEGANTRQMWESIWKQ